MKHSGRFIILHHTRLGDNSLILHTLSREWGRRGFICKAGRSMGMYQPLSIIDAEVCENPKSSLWRMTGVTPVCDLSGIRDNLYKTSISLFIAEVLYRTVKDGANEEGLSEWCERSILMLDALPGNPGNYHLRWLLEFAGALGFSPSAEDLAPFAGNHLQDLVQLLNLPFADCLLLPLSGRSRSEIAEILLKYISHHAESSLNVRSLRVLQELFAD